jgi:hypothetical protein
MKTPTVSRVRVNLRTKDAQAHWDNVFRDESNALRDKRDSKRSAESRMALAAAYADLALEVRRRSQHGR